jgi:hypothetical protein
MYVVLVDIFALILVVGGTTMILRRPSGAAGPTTGDGADPGTYARRIGGTMVAAFGLAVGLMVTLFHFASAE